MQQLYTLYYRLITETNFVFKRYLYDTIDWNDRLIIIKGPKGVGKTTLMLQRIKEKFADDYKRALFVSLDHVWFSTHTILELAEYHYAHGGTHLFLDEIHKYPNWAQEVKNIYDYYPHLHIVATGSSLLRIDTSSNVDLSRRHVSYNMSGLSFREFLILEGYEDLGPHSLYEILANHGLIAASIVAKLKVLPLFEKYLRIGFYPYYKESENKFYDKLLNSLINVIESDIPLVGKIDIESIYKIKKLLSVLSGESPFTLNLTNLSSILEVSRNTLVKLLEMLDRAKIIHKLNMSNRGLKSIQKPEKILFNDTNIMYLLREDADKGTARETYAASQLSVGHTLLMPFNGDLLVDETILLEVGGKKKSFKQIKDLPNSYVIADDIEIGAGNKIPLWLLGLLY